MAERNAPPLAVELAARFAEILSGEIRIEKVILFGSYAKGESHRDSDIDIAVVSPDFTGDRLEDQLRLMKSRRKVDLRIEPIPFRPEEFTNDNPFVREIMDTGTLVSFTR